VSDFKMMKKGERDDLLKLVRARERVLKSAAEQRGLELLAEFEANVSAIYAFNKDETWAAAMAQAKAAIDDAQKIVASRCAQLGIPEEFAPEINVYWHSRGENASNQRVAELRRKAKAEIAAIEQAARVEIERMSINAQTDIIRAGLESDGAKAFFDQLPTVERLMPALDMKQIESKVRH
jgi:hypothetical protein